MAIGSSALAAAESDSNSTMLQAIRRAFMAYPPQRPSEVIVAV